MQRYERELEVHEKGEELKVAVFASNPKLYNELYGEEMRRSPDHLDDEEIVFPETEAEFRSMVASMQRHGAIPHSDVANQEQGD